MSSRSAEVLPDMLRGGEGASSPAVRAAGLPLCVDLDGTLLHTDTLVEGLLGVVGRPAALLDVAAAARRGRAALKRAVAEAVPLDPALLPYNEALLAWLRQQRAAGRTLVLVTAADGAVAASVAAHLGLFDDVMASDGTTNLKAGRKAAALVARFGRGGFVYAGDATADLPVWREAAAAVVVGGPGLARAAAAVVPVEACFAARPDTGPDTTTARARAPGRLPRAMRLPPALRAMRPHQWVKNVLVFVPIFTAQALGERTAWIGALLAFAAFCATASAIYVLNDLSDLEADRRHVRKRRRPFASGALSPGFGLAQAALLLATGLALAMAGGLWPSLGLYAALSIGYSVRLKTWPLVDVFALAALYTIRLFAGGQATAHPVSLWLLAFSSFLFLGLAFVKRVEELMALVRAGGRRTARRGYEAGDVAMLQLFGVGATFAATLVLALYVQSEAIAARYASPALLWGLVPLILFWQCRLWLATARGYMHDDPIVYAARDRVSWAVAAAILAVLVLARFPLAGAF